MPRLHEGRDQRFEIAERLPRPGEIFLHCGGNAAQMEGFDDVGTTQAHARGVLGFEETVGVVFTSSDDQGHVNTAEVDPWQALLL
ncbi:hypothetical protein D3C73_805440 [compost metagenome]